MGRSSWCFVFLFFIAACEDEAHFPEPQGVAQVTPLDGESGSSWRTFKGRPHILDRAHFHSAIFSVSENLFQTPRVYVDAAHHNYHTLATSYAAFGDALREDGFLVVSNRLPFSAESLSPIDVLVIANAQHADDVADWSRPNTSAFTDAEIAAVEAWVRDGGSLFLIADHMPMPGGAQQLAAAFGVDMYDGMLVEKENFDCIRLTFSLENGMLADTMITRGLSDGDRVDHVRSFCGSAFDIPAHAVPILTLNEDMVMSMPDDAWGQSPDSPMIDAKEMVQGAVLEHGHGRVAVFGEAQIFTCKTETGGMCDVSADQNKRFLYNVVRWLDFQDLSE